MERNHNLPRLRRRERSGWFMTANSRISTRYSSCGITHNPPIPDLRQLWCRFWCSSWWKWIWLWADPMDNNPNTTSWESMFMFSHCCRFSFSPCISFVSSTTLTAPPSVNWNDGGDGNKQRAGDASKKDLADAPSTSNDMSVTICEGL